MSYSALLIGCGNIGALYDLNIPGKVWTHARALSQVAGLDLFVYDTDKALEAKISAKYSAKTATISSQTDFRQFQLVCLTTPTPTHFDYLHQLLIQHVPVIICEKPVAADAEQVNALITAYSNSTSRVFVNYMRRFQPAFRELRAFFNEEDNRLANCRAINIKYQRGFLNNAGHAFDLLEYLFQQPLWFQNFSAQKIVYDAFNYDPTITAGFTYNEVPVALLGLDNLSYTIFEVEFLFPAFRVSVLNSGDSIRLFRADNETKQLKEDTSFAKLSILDKYMVPVIDTALEAVQKEDVKDNFLEAASLNLRILEIINSYKDVK